MKVLIGSMLLALLGGCSAARLGTRAEPVARPPATTEDDIAVYFSPEGGALAAVLKEIGGATRSIDVQAYVITSRRVVDALEAAHARGVTVRVILDKSNIGGLYSANAVFAGSKVPLWRDGKHKGLHDKVMLIDGQTIITGSFNFTDEAEINSENLLVIRNKPKLFAAYQAAFDAHREHSDPPN